MNILIAEDDMISRNLLKRQKGTKDKKGQANNT